MLIKAVQKTTRQTPRKLALVANTVRGESLADAIKQLGVMPRRASLVILKVIRQAVANAVHNHQATFSQLELRDIIVNEGPRYRRWRAASRGRAHSIIKRTSHVTVILEIKEQSSQMVKPKVTVARPKPQMVEAKKKTFAKTKNAKKNVKTTAKVKFANQRKPHSRQTTSVSMVPVKKVRKTSQTIRLTNKSKNKTKKAT